MQGWGLPGGPFGRQADVPPEMIVKFLCLGRRRPKLRWMDEGQKGRAKDPQGAVLRNGGLDACCKRDLGCGVVVGHMRSPVPQGDRAFLRVNQQRRYARQAGSVSG